MKKAHIFLLLCVSLLSLTGCSDEPGCGEVGCGSGVCYQDVCLSETEYIEALGSAHFQAFFMGDWQSGRICPSGSSLKDVQITDGVGEDGLELSALGPEELPVRLRFLGTDLVVPEQLYGLGAIMGAGGIDTLSGKITLDYQIQEGNKIIGCTSVLERR